MHHMCKKTFGSAAVTPLTEKLSSITERLQLSGYKLSLYFSVGRLREAGSVPPFTNVITMEAFKKMSFPSGNIQALMDRCQFPTFMDYRSRGSFLFLVLASRCTRWFNGRSKEVSLIKRGGTCLWLCALLGDFNVN